MENRGQATYLDSGACQWARMAHAMSTESGQAQRVWERRLIGEAVLRGEGWRD